MKPGGWLAPVQISPCPECRLQTAEVKRQLPGARSRWWHTGTGKWVKACSLAVANGEA